MQKRSRSRAASQRDVKESRISFLAGLVVLLALVVCMSALWVTSDPLYRLEARGRTSSAYTGIAALAEGNDLYWQTRRLQDILTGLGATVTYTKAPPDQYGVTMYEGRTIMISEDLPWNARFEVLAHEAGHLLSPPALKGGPGAEIFAEGVAAVLCTRVGDEGFIYRSAKWVAGGKGNLDVLHIYRAEIYRVADFIDPR